MSTCKICKCSDLCACKGGCFWVNRDNTICSSCAVKNEIVFENRITGKKAIIIAAHINEFAPGGLAVRIKYNEEKIFEIGLMDFMYHYNEVQS